MSTPVPYSGPHIQSRDSVRRKMWEVAAALLPATIAATVFFGPYALYLVLASAVTAAVLERPFTPGGFSWREPLGDGSAFLAGMLLGLTLSPGSPWWIPLLGAALVVFVGKQAFGGIGHNIFNPALVARAILLLAYPALLTEWRAPFAPDVVTTATPLVVAGGATPGSDYLSLFLGNVAGSIGETSVLALAIGAAFLVYRGFVGWQISLTYIGSAALTAWLIGVDPLTAVLAGSLMFAALFMATDMVTSPVGRSARVVYGVGCGVLTILIRHFTLYPEGTTFAILLMNGATPLIDVLVVDSFFGEVDRRIARTTTAVAAIAVSAVVLVAGFGAGTLPQRTNDYYVTASTRQDIRNFFPGARHAMAYAAARQTVKVEQVYAGQEPVGYLLYTAARGYKSTIRVVVALDMAERIIGLRVADHAESATLGALVRRPSFLGQFLRRSTADPTAPVSSLQAISGATVSSRAVASAIEEALLFRTAPPDPRSTLPLTVGPDGVYVGTARGYNAPITVRVTVGGGRVRTIEVTSHAETPGIGEPALSRLASAVIAAQSLQIDMVSGATGSSRGFLGAVQAAIER